MNHDYKLLYSVQDPEAKLWKVGGGGHSTFTKGLGKGPSPFKPKFPLLNITEFICRTVNHVEKEYLQWFSPREKKLSLKKMTKERKMSSNQVLMDIWNRFSGIHDLDHILRVWKLLNMFLSSIIDNSAYNFRGVSSEGDFGSKYSGPWKSNKHEIESKLTQTILLNNVWTINNLIISYYNNLIAFTLVFFKVNSQN